MLKFAIVLMMLISVGAVIAQIPTDATQYLDGEYGAPIVNAPYTVSIQRKNINEYAHICNGAIIDTKTIVTTAQCLHAVKGTNFKVRVGSTYWNSGGTLETVKSFKIHEHFNPINKHYDIGIIRLNRALIFNMNIKPLLLAYGTPNNSAFAFIAGWASASKDVKDTPKTLQYHLADVISRTQCATFNYGYGNEIQNTMICARGVDTCQFGSGGPLVVSQTLAGIASWSNGCGNPRYPQVYTDISAVRFWIMNNAQSI